MDLYRQATGYVLPARSRYSAARYTDSMPDIQAMNPMFARSLGPQTLSSAIIARVSDTSKLTVPL
jgi:hypothetical protein